MYVILCQLEVQYMYPLIILFSMVPGYVGMYLGTTVYTAVLNLVLEY
jgi:hypothetical protein